MRCSWSACLTAPARWLLICAAMAGRSWRLFLPSTGQTYLRSWRAWRSHCGQENSLRHRNSRKDQFAGPSPLPYRPGGLNNVDSDRRRRRTAHVQSAQQGPAGLPRQGGEHPRRSRRQVRGHRGATPRRDPRRLVSNLHRFQPAGQPGEAPLRRWRPASGAAQGERVRRALLPRTGDRATARIVPGTRADAGATIVSQPVIERGRKPGRWPQGCPDHRHEAGVSCGSKISYQA